MAPRVSRTGLKERVLGQPTGPSEGRRIDRLVLHRAPQLDEDVVEMANAALVNCALWSLLKIFCTPSRKRRVESSPILRAQIPDRRLVLAAALRSRRREHLVETLYSLPFPGAHPVRMHLVSAL